MVVAGGQLAVIAEDYPHPYLLLKTMDASVDVDVDVGDDANYVDFVIENAIAPQVYQYDQRMMSPDGADCFFVWMELAIYYLTY